MELARALLRLLGFGPSKIQIAGSCRQSGNCCRNLILFERGRPIKTLSRLRRLQRREPIYQMFHPRDSQNEDGLLRFHCSNLSAQNSCSIYESRPEVCRDYPMPEMFIHGGSLLHDCGFRLVDAAHTRASSRPRMSFDDVLDQALKSDLENGLES